MKVIIAGSRNFDDYLMLKLTLDCMAEIYDDIEIISGGARGADKLGEQWAKENSRKIHTFIPDWDGLGKSAGYRRNEDMAKFGDAAVCFWDGVSRGTEHMINLAKKHKLKLKVVRY
jgi:hypothetical protein